MAVCHATVKRIPMLPARTRTAWQFPIRWRPAGRCSVSIEILGLDYLDLSAYRRWPARRRHAGVRAGQTPSPPRQGQTVHFFNSFFVLLV